MKTNITKMMIFILMIAQLWACGGQVPAGEIPLTGEETSTPTNTAESNVVPASTQTSQSSVSQPTPSQASSPESPTCQTPVATIKSNNAYLRDGPDLRFGTGAHYKSGDKLIVVGHFNEWYQVESSDGQTGWLYEEWLTIPSNIELSSICSVQEQDLPTLSQDSQKNNEEDGEDCVPTYYDSCDG